MKTLCSFAPKFFVSQSSTLFYKPSVKISFLKKGLEKMKSEQEKKINELKAEQQQQLQFNKSVVNESGDLLTPNANQEKINTRGVDPYAEASSDKISDEMIEQLKNQELQDELQFEELSKQHRELQAQINRECDIPFKIYGMLRLPKTKAAYMPERVFAEQRIPKYMVIDHLKKIYFGTLHSIVQLDEEFLNEYLEPSFAKKVIEQIKSIQNQGYKLELYQDHNGIRGEPITQEAYLGDMVMIRGLSIDRTKNLGQNEYHMWKDIDDMGLVVYTPRYLSDPLEFIDPTKNKTIYDDYKKVIMRVMLYLKNPYRIRIVRPDGTPVQVDDNLYSWEHIGLFETQMRPPPQFKSDYKLENYMEWLGKFNFGVWRMADLDNWNLGNPLIVRDSDRDKFKDEIFKDSKYDPEYNIDIKNV